MISTIAAYGLSKTKRETLSGVKKCMPFAIIAEGVASLALTIFAGCMLGMHGTNSWEMWTMEGLGLVNFAASAGMIYLGIFSKLDLDNGYIYKRDEDGRRLEVGQPKLFTKIHQVAIGICFDSHFSNMISAWKLKNARAADARNHATSAIPG